MLVDLIHITTRDGVRLDGMLQRPATRDSQPAWPIDAVCVVHGTGGNFYGSTLFDAVGERCLERGCAVLRINTRGHDGISTAVTSKGGRRLGAAFEIVDDCRHDLTASVDWLKSNVGPRVGLIGHSLGAVKCLYASAHEPTLEAACIIGISPPRLSYAWFCTSPEGPAFLDTYQQADALMHTGRPTALLEVQLPLPIAITAAGYIEKYGPDERYNYLNFLPSVRPRTLITLGAIESANNMAFRGAADALTSLRRRPPSCTFTTIADADHFYSKARAELIACIDSWMLS